MPHKINQSYADGIASEREIFFWLWDNGHQGTVATPEQNIQNDIDCWIDGKACSIKTQHRCLDTGNLCFELQVKTQLNEWKNSWYYNSKAEMYLIRVGNTLYSMDKLPPRYLMTQKYLSPQVQQEQIDSGHFHTDAIIGLVSMQTLISHGMIDFYGELNSGRPEVTQAISSDKGGQIPSPRILQKPTLKSKPTH